MFGVLISRPKAPTSEDPKSSATMTRKLGLLLILTVAICAFIKNRFHWIGPATSGWAGPGNVAGETPVAC